MNTGNNSVLAAYELYSFDIFDTLITRTTAQPKGIFTIMQDILISDEKYFSIPQYVRENFCDYRTRSEHYQYAYNKCLYDFQDCTFEEIYQNFKQNFDLTDSEINLLKNLELETEYNNLLPLTENINTVKDLISNGKKVILISDMYHSAEVIRQFLLKFDNIFKDIEIIVSNEWKKKKRGCELYKAVQEKYGIPYENWHHFGDNRVSDVKDAKSLSICAEQYAYPALKEYEKEILIKYSFDSTAQLTIGCSKNTRLLSDNSKFHLGSSLTSAILVPYVMWLLEESVKKGIKRLYFIARDGYILKKIADYIIEYKKLDIRTKYIYGSRLAWQRPSFAVSMENLKPVVLQYGFKLDFLSKILNMPREELKSYLPEEFSKSRHSFNMEKRKKMLEALLENDKFTTKMKEENIDNCQNLIGYLKQEIDYTDDNFAFVDLSGSGVTQNCLASVIGTFYNKPINSFYFRNGKYKVEAKNVNRFIFTFRNDGCALLELTSRAPHGQTVGYKFDSDTNKYNPVLENSDFDHQSWDFDAYLQGIMAYTKLYMEMLETHNIKTVSPVIGNEYLEWMKGDIDKQTAEDLGTIVFSHAGKHEEEVAPKISKFAAFKYLLGISDLNTDLYNLSYSRSKTSVQKILEYKEKHPSLRKQLIHIHFIKKRKEFFIRILGIKIDLSKFIWGKKE